jgi:hypothetical protein
MDRISENMPRNKEYAKEIFFVLEKKCVGEE